VFGLEVPQGLVVAAEFTDTAQLNGKVELDSVLNALQKQLVSSPIELGNRRAVFPSAYVKGDAKRRLYRIEIAAERSFTTVKISDITPPPVVQGLDEDQRWERAGRNPDGTLKDRLKVY
jgi:hypothetical protein